MARLHPTYRRLALAVCALLHGASALAQTPPLRGAPAAPLARPLTATALVPAAAPELLLYDRPGDGALWARGATWKARFDAQGATLVPRFGGGAPRGFPLELELASATLDGVALPFSRSGAVERDGALVRIDRGAFAEEYELAPRSLEQRFVFAELPRRGELRLSVAVSTELQPQALGADLRFANEHGEVRYGEAFVLDAAGRRAPMERALVAGGIELRVPASFVAAAELPLVIDPVITVETIVDGPNDEVAPDVAYDAGSDTWCVVWTETWDPFDQDVLARLVAGDGTPLGTLPIDITSEPWITPAVASNRASGSFLVCAAAFPDLVLGEIRGRFVAADTGAVSAALLLSPPDGGHRELPDVGGDSFPVPPSNFCVVWQRPTSDGSDIDARVVSPAGELGVVRNLNQASAHNHFPSISNATGESAFDGQEAWTIVWQRRTSSQHDIYGAQLYWEGSVRQSMFQVTNSSLDETRPSVSTLLDSEGFGLPRTFLVVWELDLFSHYDLAGAVMQDRDVLWAVNLTGYSEGHLLDQRAPAVDSDGVRFLVAYEHSDPGAPGTADILAAGYYWLNGELVACERGASLATTAELEGEPALCSKAAAGGEADRFLAAWSAETTSGDRDVHGALWDGCSGIPPQGYCAGDGLLIPCPCGNEGAIGHGCGNSAHAEGALLSSGGDASVAHDDFVLLVSGSTPGQPGLFFQGDERVAGGVGAPFGAGLRCAGGSVERLQLRTADANGSAQSSVGIAAALGLEAGDIRQYQWWYRDPQSPCGASFALSNGLEVIWAP